MVNAGLSKEVCAGNNRDLRGERVSGGLRIELEMAVSSFHILSLPHGDERVCEVERPWSSS